LSLGILRSSDDGMDLPHRLLNAQSASLRARLPLGSSP